MKSERQVGGQELLSREWWWIELHLKSERRVGGQKLVENEDEMKNKTGTPKNKEQTQRLD
ncbi:hypothetical protein PMAC_000879 [Pneumocystis sp. 'macacae']|nr:hypothetical protein PMAC_001054 [Pneumocystis sp. 'macacae']KAG5513841.1 hypothetical protein PMAC_000879 [Pneumocystis sp. 'macacae']